MNQSLKAVLGCVIFLGAIGCFTWLGGAPGETWHLKVRWIALAMVIVPIPVLVWANRRRDIAPDFLGRVTSAYFERDGFCFSILPEVIDGVCSLVLTFQNRYERPCRAAVVLSGSKLFLRTQAKLVQVAVGISCDAAAFGRASIAWPIPEQAQGREVSIDVAASVKYPKGRGRLLRFHDGLRVGAAGADFWQEGIRMIGALSGTIVVRKPARIKLRLPKGVLDRLESPPQCTTEILWKLGDPVTTKISVASHD